MRHSRRDAAIATLVALTAFASNPARGQTADAPSGASADSTTAPLRPAAPQVVHRLRAELAIFGAVIFVATWLPAVVIGATGGHQCEGQSCRDAYSYLPIPVLGPVIAAAQVNSFGWYAWPWSLAQGGGLAMLVAGLIGHHVPADPDKSTITIMPTASPHSAGLALSARF